MARRRPRELAGGTPEGPVRIEPLRMGDVASAVEFVSGVQRVAPGDRGEQFASDITDDSRQMFVAKVNGQVIAYGRVMESAAGEAATGTPAGYYLSGVLVAPAWRRRGIAELDERVVVQEPGRGRLHLCFEHLVTVLGDALRPLASLPAQ